MSDTKRLTKAFGDALATPVASPAEDWVPVGRGFLAEAIDHLDWLEKGNAEWRECWKGAARQNTAARATSRVAISHLQAVLNKACTHAEKTEVPVDKAGLLGWLNECCGVCQ